MSDFVRSVTSPSADSVVFNYDSIGNGDLPSALTPGTVNITGNETVGGNDSILGNASIGGNLVLLGAETIGGHFKVSSSGDLVGVGSIAPAVNQALVWDGSKYTPVSVVVAGSDTVRYMLNDETISSSSFSGAGGSASDLTLLNFLAQASEVWVADYELWISGPIGGLGVQFQFIGDNTPWSPAPGVLLCTFVGETTASGVFGADTITAIATPGSKPFIVGHFDGVVKVHAMLFNGSQQNTFRIQAAVVNNGDVYVFHKGNSMIAIRQNS